MSFTEDKEMLLRDFQRIEANTISREKNFDNRNILIRIFKYIYDYIYKIIHKYNNDYSSLKTDVVNMAEKESKRLGVVEEYDWHEIFANLFQEKREEEVDDIKSLQRESKVSLPSESLQEKDVANTFNMVKNSYLSNFHEGEARADGNCFFDSFRQGLEQQKGIKVTVNQLRKDCREFAGNNPPQWFKIGIFNSFEFNTENNYGFGEDYGKRSETVYEYISNIMRSDRWGDPEIEGRILCQKYEVKLHVIEINPLTMLTSKHSRQIGFYDHLQQPRFLHQLVTSSQGLVNITDENDRRMLGDDVLHIINKGNAHFIPLFLKKSKSFQQVIEQQNNDNLQKDTDYLSKDEVYASKLQAEEYNSKQNSQPPIASSSNEGKNLLQEQEDFLYASKLQAEEYKKCNKIVKLDKQDNALLKNLKKNSKTYPTAKQDHRTRLLNSRSNIKLPPVK